MDVLQMFQIVNTLFAGVFGLIIGSFLNVCIYRIPEGRTIVKGHSMCMSCGHVLGAPDLVPLFSWLFLKGKCRYCGSPIASRYAKIESLTGLVFAALSWQRREYYYLPGLSGQELTDFLRLIILLFLACVVIVSMMIQKDHKTGMYRLSFYVFFLLAARVFLCIYKPADFGPVLRSVSEALLISAGILVLLIIFSPIKLKSPRLFFSDIFTGKSIREYFSASNRTIRTTDLLFFAVTAVIGIPAAVFCLFTYAVVRTIRNQERLLPYMGIIIAASALAGVIVFPGPVF